MPRKYEYEDYEEETPEGEEVSIVEQDPLDISAIGDAISAYRKRKKNGDSRSEAASELMRGEE